MSQRIKTKAEEAPKAEINFSAFFLAIFKVDVEKSLLSLNLV